MNEPEIKDIAKNLGADLCGIASSDRFNSAPAGFKPLDIFPDCKSVIVFAKRVPSGSLYADSCIPYTYISEVVTRTVDLLTTNLCLILEDLEIGTVPIPSDDPSDYWEVGNQYARGILSLRHAGYLAGLGALGKNTLLVNEDYGNMIQLGAVLADIKLKSDPIIEYNPCLNECRLCIDSCPQKALNGETVDQKLCRVLSNFRNKRGFILKNCHKCRSICPHSLGYENKE